MRSSTPRDLSGMCPRCYLKLDLCLCSELTCVRSNIQIVIVRHVREERLTSNTGGLAALSLPRRIRFSTLRYSTIRAISEWVARANSRIRGRKNRAIAV